MSLSLLPILAFLAVVTGVFAVVSLLTDLFQLDHKKVQDRLDVEFRNKQREKVKRSLLFKGAEPFQAILPEGVKVPRLAWRERIQATLDQSGLDLTPNRLLAYCGSAAAAGALLVGLLLHSLLFGIAAGAVCAFFPFGYLRIKINRRHEAIRRQLSDAFDLMARVLRAGQSMTQAMLAVSTDFPSPIAEEFAYCAEQQNLGLAAEISMRDLARRTGLVEMNIFVVAVLVQRQVGGNLSEILEKLALVVRQRYKTRGLISSLTAEGRMQAGVLMALPPLLLSVMLFSNYEYEIVLFQQPYLLGGMLFFMALGGLWIRKIVNFDF